MDNHTFGDSDAATILAELIENSEGGNWKSAVKRRLDKFRTILNNLENVKNREHQKYLAHLLLKDYKKNTKQNNWPEKVKTFFLNVIRADYKEFVKD